MISWAAFDAFNYDSTHLALVFFFGDTAFLGVSWAMILGIAACGMDLAGIASLFKPPEADNADPLRVYLPWLLFGGWFLASIINALGKWWAITITMYQNESLSIGIADPKVLLRVVPILLSIFLWLVPVAIIGTIAVAGNNIFTGGHRSQAVQVPTRLNPQVARPSGHPSMEALEKAFTAQMQSQRASTVTGPGNGRITS